VPEPDISLHFLIQRLKVLNQVLKALIQNLEFPAPSIACPAEFLKRNNRFSDIFGCSAETAAWGGSSRSRLFVTRRRSRPRRPRSQLKDGLKLHNPLAFARAPAVL
jgi:hypothetical protein